MSPRILFLDHAGVLGGAELYLLDVARHFRESSRVVLFEEGPLTECLTEENIPVEVLCAPPALRDVARQGRIVQDLSAVPAVLTLAWQVARRARNFDLIYANSQKSLVVAALAGMIARRQVIWNLHDILTASHFSSFHRLLSVRLANALVARVIVNSRATQRAFCASGGRLEKTGIVYNGIDPGAFAPIAPAALQGLRAELRLPEKPLVGIFSRLARWKGQHVLLEALACMPDVHAILVGEALFDSDLTYSDEVKNLAEHLGVRERVHFLGFRDDIPQLMQLTDVVVHASIAAEPFGRVIVEGMMAGKPVVATAAGGALEIIENEKTGLLVAPGSPEALADALSLLLTRPALAAKMGKAGCRAAREQFSRDKMIRDIIQQVARVIERG